MQFNQEILIHLLQKGNFNVTIYPHFDMAAVFEKECYRSLAKIRDIIRDDTLSDEDCFLKIEEIICILEEMGSDGGIRHDF